MRKLAAAIAMITVLMVGVVPVNADIGMPAEPLYKVAISIYGADYYKEWDDFEAGVSSGTFAGGEPFYVWGEYGEDGDRLWGTTDKNLGNGDSDKFVYISAGNAENENYEVPEDTGEDLGGEEEAVTTDDLNLRKGPGTGFKSVTVLKKGTEVTYRYLFKRDTADADNAEWVYASADGKTGWVSVRYLKVTKVAGAEAEPAADNGDTEDVGEANDADQTADDKTAAAEKKYLVAGIICICLGAAILIAVIAIWLIRRRK